MIIPGENTSDFGGDLRDTRSQTNARFVGRGAQASELRDRTTSASYNREDRAFRRTESQNRQLDYEKDFYPAMMDALFRCNSWIAIVMITDLLARKYRFNVPGTKANLNWTRRIQRSIAKLRSGRKERKRMQLIRELLEKTGRV